MSRITTNCTPNKTYTADRCGPLVQAVRAGAIELHALAHGGYPGTTMDAKTLPEVLSVGFWDAKSSQKWGLKSHCNEGLEVAYLETGTLAFTAEGRTHLLEPGQLTVTRPWQPHALGNPNIEPGRLHWVILDVGLRRPHQPWRWPTWMSLMPKDKKRLTELFSQNETLVWTTDAQTAAYFIRIAEILQKPDKINRISMLAVLINGLFVSLLEMMVSRDIPLNPQLTTSERSAQLFLESLKSNPSALSQDWTTPIMAKHCGFGVTFFTRLCKKITNMTPMEYLNYLRVEKAAHLLKQYPHRTVTDIGFECGFNTSQYFATVFARYNKCSPKQYRNRT